MRKPLKKFLFFIVFVMIVGFVILGCEDSSTPVTPRLSEEIEFVQAQATTSTRNVTIPVNLSVFIPCTGEDVLLSGDLHILNHITWDGNGGYHLVIHANYQQISGISPSGVTYQAIGATQRHFNGNVGEEFTYINNFHFIGQGPGNNSLVHHTLHYTITANGEMMVEVDNFKAECQ